MVFVPLEVKKNDQVLWSNDKPGSFKMARPLLFAFAKENDTNTSNFMEACIGSLAEPLVQKFPNDHISANVEVKPTMCDGKAVNALVHNAATTRCPVCLETWATFKNMLPNENLPEDEEMVKRLKYGPSSLHARIRLMEFFLSLHLRVKTINIKDKDLAKKEMEKLKTTYQVCF